MKTNCVWRLCFLFCLLGLVACDNNDGIYFTQDEIIGDILTGKQVALQENTVEVYTGNYGERVNVQGAKGDIQAVSSDERVVSVTYGGDLNVSVVVKALSVGKASVTVTDAEGNSACFAVESKDGEELWSEKSVATLSDKQCVVEGVTAAESAAIVADVEKTVTDAKWVIKERSYIPGGTAYRLYVYDKADALLLCGWLETDTPDSDPGQLSVYSDEHELLASYTQVDDYFVKDLTETYRTRYPQVTKVQVLLHFE